MEKGVENSRNVINKALINDKFDFNLVPNYLVDNDIICFELICKDLYMSVVHLADQFGSLKKEHDILKSDNSILKKENNKCQEELEHLGHHVVALESNLRTLRHTITHDSLIEGEIPKLSTCHLAGGTIGE